MPTLLLHNVCQKTDDMTESVRYQIEIVLNFVAYNI